MFRKRFRLSSLRKHPTFCDVTTGFPAKWRLRNERSNSILMTCYYSDRVDRLIGRAERDIICLNQSVSLPRSGYYRVISMDWFLRSYLRRHLMGKPVLSLQIIGCFFRLAFDMLSTFYRLKSQNYRFSTDLQRREKINFSLLEIYIWLGEI